VLAGNEKGPTGVIVNVFIAHTLTVLTDKPPPSGPSKTLVRSPQQLGDGVQRSRYQAVVRPHATLLPGEQTRINQHLQVVGNRRLRKPYWISQLTNAGLPIVVRRHERQQPQPGRVGHGLEYERQRLGLTVVERFMNQRRAAVGRIENRQHGRSHEQKYVQRIDSCRYNP
jgi:hypothetical protein